MYPPKCVDCGEEVIGEYARVCCACKDVMHDRCWMEKLSSMGGDCACGGGMNLFGSGMQITLCYQPEKNKHCRCERLNESQ